MQNTNRVYIAAVAGLFFAFAPSVWAQVPVRALRNGLKAAQRTGAELVSPWTKVKISLPTQSMQHIPLSKSQPNAPFAQRVALRFPAASLQYYRATRGMSREQALREVARLRVESAVSEARGTHAWPQVIKEGAITVPDFNGLTLDGFMGRLGTPIPTSKIYLYRGMGLQEAGLRNILKNGLRPEDSGSMSNEVNVQTHLCSSGTMPTSSYVLEKIDTRQTFLTTRAESTLHFAALNSFQEGRIPVIVTVRNWRTPETSVFVAIRETIPASDFTEVSAFIKGPDGEPLWCRVELAADGESFVFTPYAPRP